MAPDSSVAHHALGLYQIRSGNVRAALKSFQKAVTLAPDNGEAHYIYAVALNDSGEIEMAIDQLQRGLTAWPYHVEMLQFLISLLEGQNRMMEAAGYRARLQK